MNPLAFLIFAFRTPSAFYDAPWKYARNVIGHTAAVGALPAFLLAWQAGTISGFATVILEQEISRAQILAAGFVLVGILYGLWERAQHYYFRAGPADCAEDWAFVMQGQLIAIVFCLDLAAIGLPLLALWLARLAAGVLLRKTHFVVKR